MRAKGKETKKNYETQTKANKIQTSKKGKRNHFDLKKREKQLDKKQPYQKHQNN